MQLRTLCCLILIGISTQNAVCQQAINFRTYSTAEGLPYGTVHEIWQDSRGFIWLLAENGLTRFDGFQFVSYRNLQNKPKSLASSSVYTAFNGPGNQVYFKTSTSISRYNYEDETFDHLIRYSGHSDVKWIGAINNTFYALCESGLYLVKERSDTAQQIRLPDYITDYPNIEVYQIDDYLYISNSNALSRLQPGTGKTLKLTARLNDGSIITPDRLINIIPFRSGKEIFLSTYKHLFKFNEQAQEFREINARPTELHSARINTDAHRYLNQVIYTVDKNNDIVAMDLISGTTKSLDLSKITGVAENFKPEILNSNSASTKNIWIACQSSGMLLIDGQTLDPATATLYHTGNSNLKSNNFNTILDVDPNVIWLYSPGFGLVKGEKTKFLFQSYNPDLLSKKGFPTNEKNVRALYSNDSSMLYIGTLSSGKKVKFHPEFSSEVFLTSPIAAIVEDKNTLWFSAWGRKSIYAYDQETKKTVPVILDTLNFLYSEYFARTLWCNQDNSIYYITTGKELHQIKRVQTNTGSVRYEKYTFPLTGHKLNFVFTIIKYQEDKLLLGSSNGLYVFDLKTKSVTRFHQEIPSAHLFNQTDVRSLSFTGNDTLWIGTNGNGLFSYSVKTGTCVNYTTETGLNDNSIYAILRDRRNNVWMSSNKGIFKLDPASGKTQSFSYKDGISFEEFNTNAAAILPDGKMAFGGIGGFVIFHPDSIQESISVKSPVLLRVIVNNHQVPIKEEYHLEHHQNYITMQFASLEQFRQDEFTYAYQLEGLDPDWIYCGKRRFISYANLKPGTYLLKIKCTNYNGIWNDKILRIPLTIDKPWYQTWYFIGFLLFTISVIIYGLFRLRLNQRTKLLLIRDSIARDLHDEIGANLSTISIYSEIAKDNLLKNKEGVPSLLDKISAYSQMSQESMSDIVWMIDSRNDKFENVILKMRSLAAETIGATSNIQLHMQIDEEIHHLKIGMNQRKNFYMIYKESLNNIRKYASCRNVWITLKADQDIRGSKQNVTIKKTGDFS